MKKRIIFVERAPSESVSIERVFRQIAKDLPVDDFDVEFQSVPYGNGIAAIFKNLFFFRPRPADIYHITGDVHYISLVLPRAKTILTIHDLIFLHRRSGLRRFILKKLFLDWPLRKAGHLTVVSPAVKDEIIKYAGFGGVKVRVIENPLIDGFPGHDPQPFDDSCPVILHLGTAENKNLVNLIKAVKGIQCRLRIVGRLDAKMLHDLAASDTVYENLSGLDENQIIEEYRNADIVAFCSTYEGFGLPIIEAQAMQTPVITSDLAPMNAVAGIGAALIDPNDVSSIKNGLLRIINDREYRNSLIAAGTDNIERFNRKKIAAQYAELYRQITDKTAE